MFDCRRNEITKGLLKVERYPVVFGIISTIVPSNSRLSYTAQRSVFTAQERFEQTLRTITSIRSKVTNGLIVLLENSSLSPEYEAELQKKVDWYGAFDKDLEAIRLRDGLYKGAAEVYMLYQFMRILQAFDYDLFFKVSGRYWLTDRFDYNLFPIDRFGVLLRENTFSTRLYSVPKRLESLYLRRLKNALARTKRGDGIEKVLFKRVPKMCIQQLPYLGICGQIAVNGEFIDE